MHERMNARMYVRYVDVRTWVCDVCVRMQRLNSTYSLHISAERELSHSGLRSFARRLGPGFNSQWHRDRVATCKVHFRALSS